MELAKEEVRRQVERLLRSELFAASATHHRLLEYLVERSLSGLAGQLKEYTIGLEVFGKPPSYDPQEDSLVRHQVGRLRQKLIEYYHGEGGDDPVVVSLPKGRFELTFQRRPVEAQPTGRTEVRRWRRVALVLAVLLLGIVALLAYARFSRGNSQREAGLWSHDLETLWAPFLSSSRPLAVCVGTPLLVRFAGEGYYRHHELNEWENVEQWTGVAALSRALGVPKPIPWYNFTGVGESQAAFYLARLLSARRPDVAFARSYVLSWDQLTTHNVVFVGPPKFNLQLKEIPVEQDLVLRTTGLFNLKPQPGEPALFGSQYPPEKPEEGESHALISLTPGLNGKGSILVLAGIIGPDTLAAAEWVTDPGRASELVRRLRLPGGEMPAAFQVVLRVRFKNLMPIQSSYVLHHVLKAQPAANLR